MSVEIVKNYRDMPEYRQGFFELLPKVFPGVSFVEWYKRGCWDNHYRTYAVYDHAQKQMLANVAVSLMDIWVNNEQLRGVQFSAVSTLPEARKKGYSRQLMEMILAEYASQTDLFFLFANPSVVDFYPLFGFREVKESLFQMSYPSNVAPAFAATQLDVNNPSHWKIITDFTANHQPITQVFGASGEHNILNWSLLYGYNELIWYLPDQEVIVAAETNEGVLHIYDILHKKTWKELRLLEVLPLVSQPGTHTIQFWFTPEKLEVDAEPMPADPESPFFVKGDFALEGAPFKFPVMAQT
ncbi:hypothetical protein BKI52_14075 [marine bacterium AO1-C]|nr:hypothetical protein BKI52_14075 [marine bacterium AO1-C]